MEKPIECSECKRDPTTCFIEVSDVAKQEWHLCESCPFLEEKLTSSEDGATCSTCGTSHKEIKRGALMGCMHCYAAFYTAEKTHIGRGPSHTLDEASFDKLGKLNCDLAAALKDEQYERAAWLRDQIRDLKESDD